MRKIFYIFLFLLSIQFTVFAAKPFRFALLTDLHISVSKPQNTEDLQQVITDVNADNRIEFVLISGDISDLADSASLKMSKKILSGLRMPYYITTGNHDVNESQNGSSNFLQVFQKNTFSFDYSGFHFIGFPTVPVTKGGVGHISDVDFRFVKTELEKSGKSQPMFVITHYPLLKGDVDNQKEMTELLGNYNVKAVLNGHYHRNVLLNYDGIPGIVNRSVLRANQRAAGYSIYSVSNSLKVSEKMIGQPEKNWLTLPLQN